MRYTHSNDVPPGWYWLQVPEERERFGAAEWEVVYVFDAPFGHGRLIEHVGCEEHHAVRDLGKSAVLHGPIVHPSA